MSGYIKLYRQALENGWLQNPILWVVWCYCLLKASHKAITVKVGFQEVHLTPGQFIYGLHRAAEELKLSVWKTRASINFLKKAGNLSIKSTNKFSIITIINWDSYQVGETPKPQANSQTNRKQTATNKNDKNDKNTPAEISERIIALKSGYPNPDLIDRVFKSLASTRKSGKVTDSILLAQLEKWGEYPQGQVETAMRTYLEKGYAAEGKGEKYLLGIIRNGKPQVETAQGVPDWY